MDHEITVDALEQQVPERERHIARLRAEQAAALAALDRVRVFTADGMRTLEDWVAARLDLPHERARQLTKAARTLADHPDVAGRLASGEIGVDRAVATAELAALAPPEVVEDADGWDLGGLRREVTRWRRHTPKTERQAFRDRYLTIQPSLDNATVRGSFEVPGFEGELVTQALVERADMFGDLPGPVSPAPPHWCRSPGTASMDQSEMVWEDGAGGVDLRRRPSGCIVPR